MPKGHLTYFIGDTVDALDFNAFYVRYAGDGARNQPFHPAMMVKVLVYGYATGVFSSRKIERRLHEDLAFRMLDAGNSPSTAQSATSVHCLVSAAAPAALQTLAARRRTVAGVGISYLTNHPSVAPAPSHACGQRLRPAQLFVRVIGSRTPH